MCEALRSIRNHGSGKDKYDKAKNFISKTELQGMINKRKDSFTGAMGVLVWLLGMFILSIPVIIYTFLILLVFYPLWYVESKIKGDKEWQN